MLDKRKRLGDDLGSGEIVKLGCRCVGNGLGAMEDGMVRVVRSRGVGSRTDLLVWCGPTEWILTCLLDHLDGGIMTPSTTRRCSGRG